MLFKCFADCIGPINIAVVLLPRLIVVPHSNQAFVESFPPFVIVEFNCALVFDIKLADSVVAERGREPAVPPFCP